jgi:hypothetical protein
MLDFFFHSRWPEVCGLSCLLLYATDIAYSNPTWVLVACLRFRLFYCLLIVLLKGPFSIKVMQEEFCNLGYISLWSHKAKVYCDLHKLTLILTSLKRLNFQRNRIHTPQRSIQPQQNIRIIKLRGWVWNEWEILIYLEYLMFCCPCILQRFLANNQLDASIPFNVYIYFQLSTCFEHVVLIIRRDQIVLTKLLLETCRELEINKYIERYWYIKLVICQEYLE